MTDPKFTDPEIRRKEVGIDAPMDAVNDVERLKVASHGLRGAVLEEMMDPDKPEVSHDSYQLMKHFGMYQQDDRDTRIERKRAGLDKDFSFMVRTKVPGGQLTADQYLILDDIATAYTKGSIRLTTRQTIQFHGVGKEKLQGLSRALQTRLMTTYGACGDVVRNTMTCPVIDLDPRPEWRGREVFAELARQISDRYLPHTNAFYDIFIDGELRKDLAPMKGEQENLYTNRYMPRKFKIGITIPQDNCIDVFTQDLGLVAITEEGVVKGYNVLIGGGLGFSHSNKETYPRAASPVAYVSPEDVMQAVDAVVTIQRDYGDRTNRKHARLKYLVEEVGVEWFHAEMQRRMAIDLAGPVDIPASHWEFHDHLGWHAQAQPGLSYVTAFIDSGRIIDRPGQPTRAILRRIVEKFRPLVRLTGQQNIVFANIADEHRDEINTMLVDAGLITAQQGGKLSALRRDHITCVALPTCGLALAEAERAMPALLTQLEDMGFGDERIGIRISGCPNSCARTPAAEIGIIGCGPGKYNIFTGGDYEGTRINTLYKDRIPFDNLAEEIGRLITRWRAERNDSEAFGDWCHRLGVEALKA